MLIFLCYSSLSQTKSCNQKNFDRLEKKYTSVLAENVKLKNEIKELNQNQSYFQTALSSQTAIFSLITGGLFLIIGLISFAGIKFEIGRNKKQTDNTIKEIKSEFREIKENINDSRKSMLVQSSGISMLVCQSNMEEHPDLGIYYAIQSATASMQSGSAPENTISALDISRSLLVSIKNNDSFKSSLLEFKEDMYGGLNLIMQSEHEELTNLAAEVRVKLIEYLK